MLTGVFTFALILLLQGPGGAVDLQPAPAPRDAERHQVQTPDEQVLRPDWTAPVPDGFDPLYSVYAGVEGALAVIQTDAEWLRIGRFAADAEGLSSEGETKRLRAVPPAAQLDGAIYHPGRRMLAMVGNTKDKTPHVWYAILDEEAGFEEITATPLPEGSGPLADLCTMGDGFVLLLSNNQSGTPTLQPLTLHFAADGEATWTLGPPITQGRQRPAMMALQNRLHVIGGREMLGDSGASRPSRQNLALEWDGERWSNWQLQSLPLPRPFVETDGARVGTALVAVSPVENLPQLDYGTSTTLTISRMQADGTLSLWRDVPTSLPTRTNPMVVSDQDTGLLMLVSKDAPPQEAVAAFMMAGYLPDLTMQIAEEKARRAGDAMALWAEYTEEAALKLSEEEGRTMVAVLIPGGAEHTPFITATVGASFFFVFAQSGAIYVTQDAAEIGRHAERLGVSTLPAIVLHDREGNVLSRHEGTPPTREDLFNLTQPLRRAVEAAAPSTE